MKNRTARLALLAMLLPAVLGGCGSIRKYMPFGQGGSGEHSTAPANATEYRCEGGKGFYLRTLEGNDAVWLIYPEREVRLDKAEATGGTRYSNGVAELKFSGNTASLVDGPRNYTACAAASK